MGLHLWEQNDPKTQYHIIIPQPGCKIKLNLRAKWCML